MQTSRKTVSLVRNDVGSCFTGMYNTLHQVLQWLRTVTSKHQNLSNEHTRRISRFMLFVRKMHVML